MNVTFCIRRGRSERRGSWLMLRIEVKFFKDVFVLKVFSGVLGWFEGRVRELF